MAEWWLVKFSWLTFVSLYIFLSWHACTKCPCAGPFNNKPLNQNEQTGEQRSVSTSSSNPNHQPQTPPAPKIEQISSTGLQSLLNCLLVCRSIEFFKSEVSVQQNMIDHQRWQGWSWESITTLRCRNWCRGSKTWEAGAPLHSRFELLQVEEHAGAGESIPNGPDDTVLSSLVCIHECWHQGHIGKVCSGRLGSGYVDGDSRVCAQPVSTIVLSRLHVESAKFLMVAKMWLTMEYDTLHPSTRASLEFSLFEHVLQSGWFCPEGVVANPSSEPTSSATPPAPPWWQRTLPCTVQTRWSPCTRSQRMPAAGDSWRRKGFWWTCPRADSARGLTLSPGSTPSWQA